MVIHRKRLGQRWLPILKSHVHSWCREDQVFAGLFVPASDKVAGTCTYNALIKYVIVITRSQNFINACITDPFGCTY